MRARSFGGFVGSGLFGAMALTAAHQLLRAITDRAPRADLLGERAIARGFLLTGRRPPSRDTRQALALVGDLALNGLAYGLVTRGDARRPWRRGLVLGALMGLSAIELPPLLGLRRAPTARTAATRWMTIGLYTLGGLAAAGMVRALGRRADRGYRVRSHLMHVAPSRARAMTNAY